MKERRSKYNTINIIYNKYIYDDNICKLKLCYIYIVYFIKKNFIPANIYIDKLLLHFFIVYF